jgi:hypothetical protein
MKTEQEIIQELINKWLPLGVEFAEGAAGVVGMYFHAGSELGAKRANIFFDVGDKIVYPGNLKGAQTTRGSVHHMQGLMIEDLLDAERQFKESGIPCPTEYRISYEPAPGRLDVQLHRDLKYHGHPTKGLLDGPVDWLGDRLEEVYKRS